MTEGWNEKETLFQTFQMKTNPPITPTKYTLCGCVMVGIYSVLFILTHTETRYAILWKTKYNLSYMTVAVGHFAYILAVFVSCFSFFSLSEAFENFFYTKTAQTHTQTRLTSSWTQALYPGGLMAISMTVAEMRTIRQRGETYFQR